MIGSSQWKSTIKLLDKDIQHIESNLSGDAHPSNSSYTELFKDVPSRHMYFVGECNNYTKASTRKMVDNGLFQHSEKIQIKAVNLDIPLEHQGPFDAIYFKVLDLYSQYFHTDHVELIDKATKFCEENNILILDNEKLYKILLKRKTLDDALVELFDNQDFQDKCKEFDIVMRRPKTLLLKASENTGKEYFERVMEENKLDYPVVLKTDATFEAKLCHAKFFLHGPDGLDEVYNYKEFIAEDLVIEELVPYEDDQLFKTYAIGDEVVFWRVGRTIPLSYLEENAFITRNNSIRSMTKATVFKCSKDYAEVSKESRINVKFVQTVYKDVMKALHITLAGIDIIISKKDGT